MSKMKTEMLAAVSLAAVGSFLLIAGLFIPPMGVIHPSVLVAFGEVAVFAASLFGIDLRYKLEFNKFKSDIGVDRRD